MRPYTIAITGTHSTGKSSFLDELCQQLVADGFSVGRIDDLALAAKQAGFPILKEHTYESTLFLMAETLRQEAELSLNCEVILIDRPLTDAFGYLTAALQVTNRTIAPELLNELENMAVRHVRTHNQVLMTELDSSIPVGPGRDGDMSFRQMVSEVIAAQMTNWNLENTSLRSDNQSDVMTLVKGRVDQHFLSGHPQTPR